MYLGQTPCSPFSATAVCPSLFAPTPTALPTPVPVPVTSNGNGAVVTPNGNEVATADTGNTGMGALLGLLAAVGVLASQAR